MKTSTALGIAIVIIIGTGYLVMRDTSDVLPRKVEVVAQNNEVKNAAADSIDSNQVKNVVADPVDSNVKKDIVVIKNPSKPAPENKEVKTVVDDGIDNSVMKDGIQYVTITASGGYSPRESGAKAGVPTKLIVKTNGTYDCSASLVINSLNYRKMLPSTGETVIDAGTPKAGDTLRGLCGMGMYSFVINFK